MGKVPEIKEILSAGKPRRLRNKTNKRITETVIGSKMKIFTVTIGLNSTSHPVVFDPPLNVRDADEFRNDLFCLFRCSRMNVDSKMDILIGLEGEGSPEVLKLTEKYNNRKAKK